MVIRVTVVLFLSNKSDKEKNDIRWSMCGKTVRLDCY